MITLNREDLEINYNNGALQDYILGEYKKAIDNFDIDEEFTMLWDSSFVKDTGYTAREFIYMLEEDLAYFDVILNNHK